MMSSSPTGSKGSKGSKGVKQSDIHFVFYDLFMGIGDPDETILQLGPLRIYAKCGESVEVRVSIKPQEHPYVVTGGIPTGEISPWKRIKAGEKLDEEFLDSAVDWVSHDQYALLRTSLGHYVASNGEGGQVVRRTTDIEPDIFGPGVNCLLHGVLYYTDTLADKKDKY